MKIYTSTKNMTREQWLEARRSGIGGSDAAAIVGANPYSSALTVYADKTGALPPAEETEAMRQGTDLEDYVARRFCDETGLKVQRCYKMFRNPERPWMLANIDRQILHTPEFVGLECKTTNLFNKTDFDDGEIQPNYFWQCQHYMAVTGAPYWYLAVLILSKSFHVFKIERDEMAIETLIEAERAFWFDHVKKGIPPAPNGSDADGKAISAIYPVGTDESVDLSDLRETVQMLEGLKFQKKRIEEMIAQHEQTIKMRMGDAQAATVPGYKIMWKSFEQTRFDSNALKKAAPLVYSMYAKNSSVRRFELKREGK